MFKGLESEIRLSEQVPSSFFERNNHDQIPFLGVSCRDVFGQGGRSQGSNYITKKYFTGDSSTNIFLRVGQNIDFRIFRSGNEKVIVVSQERVSNIIEHGRIHR